MNRITLLFAFISASSTLTINQKDNVGKTSEPATEVVKSTNDIIKELIIKAESWFGSDSDFDGYDIYHQDVDRLNKITRYINKRLPNIIYQRNEMDSMDKKVVIFDQSEKGLINNQTRIVFRQSAMHPRHYTGHLAYIRKFRGQISVEWDILRSDSDKPNEVFAAAFTPFAYGISSVIRTSHNVKEHLHDNQPKQKRHIDKHRKHLTYDDNSDGKDFSNEYRFKRSSFTNSMDSNLAEGKKVVEKGEEVSASLGTGNNNVNTNGQPLLENSEQTHQNIENPIKSNPEQEIMSVPIENKSTDDENQRSLNAQAEPNQNTLGDLNSVQEKHDSEETSTGLQNKTEDPTNQNVDTSSVDAKQLKLNLKEQAKETNVKRTAKTKKPVIIPENFFENSQESSASIELSIEDESNEKFHRDGNLQGYTKGKKRGKFVNGRYLQPLGSFFGGIDLNNTIPEKRLLSTAEYHKETGNLALPKEKSNIIIEFNSNNHPLFEDKSSPFTGILECEYEHVNLSTEEYFKLTPDRKTQLVSFLLKTLRAQCINQLRENTLSLFLEDLIVLGNDMKARLNTANPIYKKKTLGKSQWDKLISSIYFTIFTDAYKHHANLLMNEKMYSRSPDAIKISLSIRTLTTMIIRGVEIIHELESHAVKISKSLITALNERYLHSLKEAVLLKSECSDADCSEEEDVNYQDRIQLRALKEFVIFGIEDTFGKKGSEMDRAFVEFYGKRLPILTGRQTQSA